MELEMEESQETIDEDITCCHRLTFCPSKIRNVPVTNPVCKSLGQHLTWANLFWIGTSIAIVLLSWLLLYALLGETMLPKNNGFGLYFLVLLSYSLGWTISYIPWLHLPPAAGMFLSGVIVHYCGLYDVETDLGPKTTSKVRAICLTFLVLRAGFQLSTTTLSKHALIVLTLAIIPVTSELIVLTLCLKYILLYQWDWSFMCGVMLACVSPVVTINGVLILAEKGYGEDKGMAGILSTGACIEEVYTVCIFTVSYSVVFKDDETKEWWSSLPYGIRDVVVGCILGLVLGIFFIFFPHRNYKYVTPQRMVCLLLGSLTCTSGPWKFQLSGRGLVGCLLMSFIATTGWRILSPSFDMVPFRQASCVLWQLVQPVLLGLIGANIKFVGWTLPRFGLHVSCILIGLVTRAVAIYLTTLHTNFTWKERLFIIISSSSKGSLQAAFGPMALDQMDSNSTNENVELAMDAVRISVITILSLAPLSAFAISVSGPYLLNKITYEEYERDRALSYVRILSLQPSRVPGEV